MVDSRLRLAVYLIKFNSELYGTNTVNLSNKGKSDCCVVIFDSFKRKV